MALAMSGALAADDLPVKVIALDVERLPSEITATRSDGTPYRSLWILARSGGVPRQLLKLRLETPVVSRDELARLLDGVADRAAELPPPPLPSLLPRISVIVCSVFAREPELRAALTSIMALRYPDFETLVVDNRPGDHPATPEWAAQLDGVRVLRERQPGLSAARNRGLAEATGSLVAFTDDDVIVDEGWLEALARRFVAHPEEVCVTGLVLPSDLDSPAQATFDAYYGGFGPQTLIASSRGLERAAGPGRHRRSIVVETDDRERPISRFSLYRVGRLGVGANMAFRTAALRETGGFDPALGAGTPSQGGEDIAMFARLAWEGRRLGFEPAALVFHRHRPDEASLERQIEGYGVGIIAALLSLIVADPRHLGTIATAAPRTGFEIAGSFWRKLRPNASAADEPQGVPVMPRLARRELRGMVKGPLRYTQSRRQARRFAAAERHDS